MTKADEAPPLIGHPGLELPAEAPSGGPSTPVRVVELASSIHVSFSGDGGTLACLASDGPDGVRPLIYDLGSDWRASYPRYRTKARTVEPGKDGAKRMVEPRVVLSHDGRLAAVAGLDPRLRVFETRTGRPLWGLNPDAIGREDVVTCLAFDDAGKVLVTGDSTGRVCAWDATGGRPMGRFPVALGFTVSVGFHPDSETVAIVSGNEDAIRLWKYRAGPEPADLLDHGDEVWGLAFARDGSTLVSVGDDDGGKAWDPRRGEVIGSYRGGVLQSAIAAAPAGDLVATGDFDGVVALRRGDLSGAVTATSSALRGTKVRTVSLSSTDPPLLVAAGNGPRVLVASASTAGELLRESLVDTPHPDIYALAFSSDGGTLAMGSHARAITLWDTREFRHLGTLSPRAAVSCLAYSPDGRTLVSGDIEGGLQFWDMPGGTLRVTRSRASGTGGVWALAFSPEGKTLATGGDDKMVRLWDPEIALERLALPGHEAKVHALAFSPDGKVLASGDFHGKIRLWHAGP
jgi:WD40 repeat protein